MSWTTLKKVDADGDVVSVCEFANAWRFQPFVWERLSEAYEIERAPGAYDRWPALWEFACDGTPLHWFEWNVLVFGYDNVIVRGDDLNLLADSLAAFHRHYVEGKGSSHCLPMADKVREIAGTAGGACIHGTSTTDDPWQIYVEADDECRTYNVNTDDNHHWAELRRPEGKGET